MMLVNRGPAPSSRGRGRLGRATLALVVGAVVTLTGCLGTPARTDRIVSLETRVVDGWSFEYFRDEAYPCAISGYQTFVVGAKVGSSATATRPLWVKMHGGGAGWFDPTGNPQPTAGNKSEESFDKLLSFDSKGLMERVEAAPEGFRVLLVSMCSHDVYAGNDTPDPYNPNTTPDGAPRPTTGLVATKAAIQYTMGRYPTDDYFLHGTSAGGAGTFHVAWALQNQGIPPAGIVSDSGVINQSWELYVAVNGLPGAPGCEKTTTEDRGYGVLGRVDPDIADPANQPDLLVSRGVLKVPVMHVWNTNDSNSCGAVPMPCPLRDGTNPVMGASECRHQPLRLAILAQGAASRSADLKVCVEGGDDTYPCDRHVVTNGRLTNTDLASAPADYQGAILTWVRARLADD